MAGYIGANTSSVNNNQNAAERRKKFTFTANTTVLSGLNFAPEKIHIFHNGIRLVRTTDYVEASDGKSVTLVNAAQAGDEVVAVTFAQDPASGGSDFVSASTGGTFSDAVTIDSNGATALTVDRATSDGTIIDVQKDGTSVGIIGTQGGDIQLGTGVVGVRFKDADNAIQPQNITTSAGRDNGTDLGTNSARFKDLYLGGGAYLGGTGASNYLTDYEIGSWTPELTINSSTSGITYTSRSAAYTKIGELVFVEGDIQLSSRGSNGGTVRIQNLPFNFDDRTGGTSLDGSAGLCAFQANTSGLHSPICLIGRGGTDEIDMRAATTNGGDISPALQHSTITNSFSIRFALTYRTG